MNLDTNDPSNDLENMYDTTIILLFSATLPDKIPFINSEVNSFVFAFNSRTERSKMVIPIE